MDIKLENNAYNYVFVVLSQAIKGHAGSAVVALKLIEQIRTQANEGVAPEVTLSVEAYELEQLTEGILHIVKSDERVSALLLTELLTFAKHLRIRKATEAKIRALVPADKTVELDSDIELDEEEAG